MSLNCEYSTAAAGTAVPLLNGVEGIGTAGGLTVQGGLSCTDSGTVNTWEAAKAGTFGGFTSTSLAASGAWPSPACPVQEAFDSWPAMFTPVGLRRGRRRPGRTSPPPTARPASRTSCSARRCPRRHRGAGAVDRRRGAGRHDRRRHRQPGRSRRVPGHGRRPGEHRER